MTNELKAEQEGDVFYPGIVDQKTLAACLETAEQIIREPRPDRIERFQRTKAKLIAQVKAHPLSFDEWNKGFRADVADYNAGLKAAAKLIAEIDTTIAAPFRGNGPGKFTAYIFRESAVRAIRALITPAPLVTPQDERRTVWDEAIAIANSVECLEGFSGHWQNGHSQAKTVIIGALETAKGAA